MSLVVLDMSQNNIDNISERSVHSVYVCSVEGAQTDFLNYVVYFARYIWFIASYFQGILAPREFAGILM